MRKTKIKLSTDWLSLFKCTFAAYKEVVGLKLNRQPVPEVLHLED